MRERKLNMVNRRAFVALAACGACAAIGGIAGCGPKSQEPTGSVPADAVSTWAIEAVAEDDNPVGTVQRDSWKLQDDGSVLLTFWGSSNPRPEPESAELDGRVLAVQLKPCTMARRRWTSFRACTRSRRLTGPMGPRP